MSSVVVGQLVDRFMKMVEEVADNDDWQESDGWIGKMVLVHPEKGSQSHVYEIRDGKMLRSDSPGPYVATITMSTDTFLQILNSAMDGTVVCPDCRSEVRRSGACNRCHSQVTSGESYAEYLFERRYATRNISYQGERWIVDSERFRKVFKRLHLTAARGR